MFSTYKFLLLFIKKSTPLSFRGCGIKNMNLFNGSQCLGLGDKNSGEIGSPLGFKKIKVRILLNNRLQFPVDGRMRHLIL